jgi:uncharacterized phage infection (PIP) family protein YhgE
MNSRRLLIAFLGLATIFSGTWAMSQEAVESTAVTSTEEQKPTESAKPKSEGSAKGIQEMMTPDEFKAAGLDKLSEDELQHLDAWLQGYRQTTAKKATEQAEEKASDEIKKVTEKAEKAEKTAKLRPDSVASRIDGSFEGLKGKTVIKLEDGTVWKQANEEDRYRSIVTDHPAAFVRRTAFGYKMRVEGMPEFYVNPVRTH